MLEEKIPYIYGKGLIRGNNLYNYVCMYMYNIMSMFIWKPQSFGANDRYCVTSLGYSREGGEGVFHNAIVFAKAINSKLVLNCLLLRMMELTN